MAFGGKTGPICTLHLMRALSCKPQDDARKKEGKKPENSVGTGSE